jgi:hypothetical protein
MPTDLTPCPSCEKLLSPSANECPNCGFRPESVRDAEILAGFSTICSILVGFTLSALVQLTSADALKEWPMLLTTGLWIVSSLMLLGVLVASDVVRFRDLKELGFNPTLQEKRLLWQKYGWIFTTSSVALSLTAIGVVVIASFFSWVHCAVAGVALFAAVVLVVRMLR